MNNFLEKKWAAYTFATCSAVVLYMLLSNVTPILEWFSSLWQMLTPVVIGFALAYMIDPLPRFFERRVFFKVKNEHARRNISVVLSVILVLLGAAAIVMMVVPSLVNSITGILSNYDNYYGNLKSLIEKLNRSDHGIKLDTGKFDSYINNALDTVLNNLKDNLTSVLDKVNSVGSTVINIVIGFIIAIYLMTGKQSVISFIQQFRGSVMVKEKFERHNSFFKRCHEIFIQYLGCNLLDGLVIGVSNCIFMMIMGMDNVSLISVIVGVTNLLPTFGPLVGAVLGGLFLVLTNPTDALVFLIFTIILQTIDAYVIKPRLFSSSLGLSPVVSLIAIILGGKMFGWLGIFLAIPVSAVLVILYFEKFLPWIKNKTHNKELAEAEKLADDENAAKEKAAPETDED